MAGAGNRSLDPYVGRIQLGKKVTDLWPTAPALRRRIFFFYCLKILCAVSWDYRLDEELHLDVGAVEILVVLCPPR